MWEIPLRPLPKRHKVRSDPKELEVHQQSNARDLSLWI